ncbi:NAD(+)--dinitrogen-reductase ADP-D-ribosyltransferase [Azohydromonas lata]|uniref:NAD(+)--dinitrogen-reductase ADP-D-ribosyltransferase n=1 Tax=Azohydromonas lata TaxID=45677 RepID=A0ABU5IQ40_9BURK|nr:NAD(+)--dinitrogen-reductase ADP-D-ribosyltransferase [Azohydromonas lata]MDZ5460995.1 NAD(+)--dinitrogen-reductase ADP-D-ribosyltransferase [Azohydromonas lata]
MSLPPALEDDLLLTGEADPARWYATNLVGIPAPLLGSAEFNAHPRRLRIAGARASSAGLFALLDQCGSAAEARGIFEHYMELVFGLAKPAGRAAPSEQRRWKASYLKLLQGWGMDANAAAGAVLKGWAESRFGLVPSFHKAPLQRFPSPAWMTYLEEKTTSRYHNNNIHQQLDLLFEFCQWMLWRFQLLGPGTHVPLWRGSTRCEEQVVGGSLRERRCTMRLNNVVSFSLSRETAGCFGDWLLYAQVPRVKLLLVPGLLDTRSLQGESEVLALGGDYEVEASYGV